MSFRMLKISCARSKMSILWVSKRGKTFTLFICLYKWGIEKLKGTEKRKTRQEFASGATLPNWSAITTDLICYIFSTWKYYTQSAGLTSAVRCAHNVIPVCIINSESHINIQNLYSVVFLHSQQTIVNVWMWSHG